MADSSWLRLIGGPGRRIPARTTSPACSEPPASVSQQQQHPQEQNAGNVNHINLRHQPSWRTLPRFPSWNGLAHSFAAPPEATTDTSELIINEADRVWHKPCIDQMADTLLAAVMSKSALEPLGPEYCSSILHLVEAYGAVRLKLADVERHLSEAVTRRQRETDDFEALAANWMIREAEYKAEVKRLEVIIHRTSSSGLEAVSMARSGTLISKNNRRGLIYTKDEHRNQETAKSQHRTDSNLNHRHSTLGRPRILDHQNDVTLSKRLSTGPGPVTTVRQTRKEERANGVQAVSETARQSSDTVRRIPSKVSSDESSSTSSEEDEDGATKWVARLSSCHSVEAMSGKDFGSNTPQVSNQSSIRHHHVHRRDFSFAAGDDAKKADELATPSRSARLYTVAPSNILENTSEVLEQPLRSLEREGLREFTSMETSIAANSSSSPRRSASAIHGLSKLYGEEVN